MSRETMPSALIEALLQRERALLVERERRTSLELQLTQLRTEVARLGGDLHLDVGDLARTSPVSDYWGTDRGVPIDRHYIARFLNRHRTAIGGRVLEVKDDNYTHAFGDGRVTRVDILDLNPSNPRANVVADLTCADHLDDNTYDCIILTQVLGLIPDVAAALGHVRRILKPGGVLLCTVPATGRLSYEPPGPGGDYWRFTEASITRLMTSRFPRGFVTVEGFGNVRAAAAFLYGLAHHELTAGELDAVDPFFPIVYGVRAAKPVEPAAAILMYHRIADQPIDPHHLSVSPMHFRAHMDYLRARGLPVVRLADLAAAAVRGDIVHRSIAITFDDGYRETITTAAPVLAELGLPATAFVVGRALEGMRFPWDETADLLSVAELEQVVTATTIDIGCHTESHVRLPDISRDMQLAEIVRCKERLESLLPGRITCFAYPYGAADGSSAAAVEQAGFACGVTTEAALVTATADRFRLPRLEIGNCDANGFAEILRRNGLID